jgi:site-specific recombinase XerD
LWRRFEGPLSASAQRHAVTILNNLYGFLVDQNYLMGNPWSAVSVPRTAGPKVNAGRSFSLAQWDFIEGQLKMLPATSANQRLRFGLHLLYATGLRLSEVVAATLDDMLWVEYPDDASDDQPLQGWVLQVIGKGQKEREVPLPIDVVGELARYLESRGLDPDPEDIGNQGAFLLGKASDAAARAPGLNTGLLDPREGIAATTFYDQIKAFFTGCANVLRGQGDGKGAERFAKASTHWMRQSHASHAIASGMPIEIAQQNLGHASLATTTVYVTTESKRRMWAVIGFWGKGGFRLGGRCVTGWQPAPLSGHPTPLVGNFWCTAQVLLPFAWARVRRLACSRVNAASVNSERFEPAADSAQLMRAPPTSERGDVLSLTRGLVGDDDS